MHPRKTLALLAPFEVFCSFLLATVGVQVPSTTKTMIYVGSQSTYLFLTGLRLEILTLRLPRIPLKTSSSLARKCMCRNGFWSSADFAIFYYTYIHIYIYYYYYYYSYYYYYYYYFIYMYACNSTIASLFIQLLPGCTRRALKQVKSTSRGHNLPRALRGWRSKVRHSILGWALELLRAPLTGRKAL